MSGQSGRILGTIAGAALAYFTGGASYVAIGATLGGAVGSLLDPKAKIEGPRLEDLKVQVSTYGIGIPTLYGTERMGGNVIWSTDKLEVANIDSQGGGKGGSGTESTSYKYYVWMRQLLCATPRDGSTVSIVRMFQDGKLIWDAGSGVPMESALASAENLYASFVLYQGHQDQLPDPEEEAIVGGPGSVSAYRGVVSIFMRAIECPGGRVPQFSFVLSNGAAVGDVLYNGQDIAIPTGLKISASRLASDGATSTMFVEYGIGSLGHQTKSVKVYGVSLDGKALISSWALGNDFWGIYTAIPGDADIDALCFRQVDSVTNADSGFNVVFGADGSLLARFELGHGFLSFGQSTSSWSKRGDYFAISGDANQTDDHVGLFSWESGGLMGVTTVPFQQKVVLSDECLWVLHNEGGTTRKLMALSLDGTMSVFGNAALPGDALDPLYELKFTARSGGGLFMWAGDPVGVDSYIWRVQLAGAAITFTLENEIHRTAADLPYPIQDTIGVKPDAMYGWERLSVGVDTTTLRAFMIAFDRVTPVGAKAKDIIVDQIELSGATSFDVSALPDSDTVYGYKIAGPASARANIEPILTAFGYFIVDEDGAIKVKRYADITSVATVAFDELGQAEAGGDPADAMPLNRTQEIDLARSMTVSYIEPTNDFQTATETEVRRVTEATEDAQIALALCIPSDQAKKVAQMALYDQHRRQNQRSLVVSRKFAAISPGDGVTVEYPRGTFKLWLVLSTNDTGAVCEWSVVPGDASIFTQTAVGATGYTQQEVAPLPPPSTLVLLDMPIVRDADSDAGKYAAIKPYGPSGWRGTSLLVSDDQVTYQDKGAVTVAAVTGFAETALSDGPFGQIDHYAQVTVDVENGELNSTTWDLLFSSGANLAALTSSFTVDGFPDAKVEIFQFRVATSLGGGRYVLSELVRGLYGTERVAYNHGVGDAFVLLNAEGMLRVSMDPGAIGSTKYYKPVSFGRSADAVTSTASQTIGYGLKPLSPVDVKLDRTPSDGSVVFTWGRRTRMSHNALRSVMPLGESSEAYEVVIYTAADYQVVARVYRVYSPTFTYVAAALAADGYSQLSSIPYRIHQISDAVGRGVPFQPGQGLQ
jgi:hypothetical protein